MAADAQPGTQGPGVGVLRTALPLLQGPALLLVGLVKGRGSVLSCRAGTGVWWGAKGGWMLQQGRWGLVVLLRQMLWEAVLPCGA
jgi:hypothetical protein